MITPPPSPAEQDNLKPYSSTGRLILVSNRLPVTVHRSGDGQFQYHRSSGGLVTCMSGLRPSQAYSWYGWPGFVEPHHNCRIRKDLMRDYSAVPVFLENDLASKHYNGFSSMSEATFNASDCY
jgi:trehalose 6-phosphate synthase